MEIVKRPLLAFAGGFGGLYEFFKLIGDRFCVAVIVQEIIRYDESFLLAHNRLQFIKRNGQTAFFDIYLLGGSEPQHILSPLRHSLVIEQMFDPDIFTYRIAAP